MLGGRSCRKRVLKNHGKHWRQGHSERFDRIKGIIEELAASQAGLEREHKRLLTFELAALKSHQQLVETQQQFAQAQQEIEERFNKLAEARNGASVAQRRTSEHLKVLAGKVDAIADSMNALIAAVGHIVRGRQ